jgi:hypothetical protein
MVLGAFLMADDVTPEPKGPKKSTQPEVIFDPGVGRFVPRASMKEALHPSRAYLMSWVWAMATVGGLVCFLYWVVAGLAAPFGSEKGTGSGHFGYPYLVWNLALAALLLQVVRLLRTEPE